MSSKLGVVGGSVGVVHKPGVHIDTTRIMYGATSCVCLQLNVSRRSAWRVV